MNIWRSFPVAVRQAAPGSPDELVRCQDCARFRLVGHRSQATRSEWSMIHRREYARALGCGLTGARQAGHRPRRCDDFEQKPEAAPCEK